MYIYCIDYSVFCYFRKAYCDYINKHLYVHYKTVCVQDARLIWGISDTSLVNQEFRVQARHN